jgi:hypothetical protein
VHGLASLPVLDIQKAGSANAGATCKNVVSKTATAKSFAMIRIMYRPYDVTSGGGAIIVGQRQQTDNGRRDRFFCLIHSSSGVFDGKWPTSNTLLRLIL